MKKIVGLIALTSLCFSSSLLAQVPPPGPGSGAPIDGGAIALVAGVVLYGYKKLKINEKTIKRAN